MSRNQRLRGTFLSWEAPNSHFLMALGMRRVVVVKPSVCVACRCRPRWRRCRAPRPWAAAGRSPRFPVRMLDCSFDQDGSRHCSTCRTAFRVPYQAELHVALRPFPVPESARRALDTPPLGVHRLAAGVGGSSRQRVAATPPPTPTSVPIHLDRPHHLLLPHHGAATVEFAHLVVLRDHRVAVGQAVGVAR